ncbi:four helix bundle protein [Candidatus Peregrinibacteria bacterium]|nr:four helix bundle protein [Candidatus Peregrinibacteria bacterium]
MIRSSFKELKIWQKGIDLAKNIYKLTKLFPKDELYGLTSQIRRAAVSVPSNIAEGSQRVSDKEFSNFVLISRGSLAELETQIILAGDFEYITRENLNDLSERIQELHKMLNSFYFALTAKS